MLGTALAPRMLHLLLGSGLPQKFEEWESTLCQSRNKPTERSQVSHELLDIFDAGWRPHHFDHLDLL
jgi:hypothetical protein